MLNLFIVLQFYYVDRMDYITQKTYQAAYIQSGLNFKVDEKKEQYKNIFDIYKKQYINKSLEEKMGIVATISDILINKKIGITYEF